MVSALRVSTSRSRKEELIWFNLLARRCSAAFLKGDKKRVDGKRQVIPGMPSPDQRDWRADRVEPW